MLIHGTLRCNALIVYELYSYFFIVFSLQLCLFVCICSLFVLFVSPVACSIFAFVCICSLYFLGFCVSFFGFFWVWLEETRTILSLFFYLFFCASIFLKPSFVISQRFFAYVTCYVMYVGACVCTCVRVCVRV